MASDVVHPGQAVQLEVERSLGRVGRTVHVEQDLVGGKLDLVAFPESIEHRRIFHSKHHGHAGHFEIGNRIVL